MGRAIKSGGNKYALNKNISAHTFRHPYAAHLLQHGTDIRATQQLLGHNDVRTITIYTRLVRQLSDNSTISPLDFDKDHVKAG